MKKYLLFFGLMMLVLTAAPALGADTSSTTWFGKAAAGVIATNDQVSDFVTFETFSFEVVKRVWGKANVWASYRYWDINDVLTGDDASLDDHAVKTMLFGRVPGGSQPAPYIFFAGATTYTPEDTTQKAKMSLDCGVGCVFNFLDCIWGAELGTKRYENKWLINLQISRWIGL